MLQQNPKNLTKKEAVSRLTAILSDCNCQTPAHRERYDLAVSRAVADLPVLCEYCLPLVKPGGFFLAYKGPEGEGECRRAAKAIQALGGRFLRVEAGTAPGMGHTLCLIQKLKVTPEKFPRKAGIPSKEPLG